MTMDVSVGQLSIWFVKNNVGSITVTEARLVYEARRINNGKTINRLNTRLI
jgi:hypothetical protein